MSPGINVRALPSTIRTVARLPCHSEAGPIQWSRPFRISKDVLGWAGEPVPSQSWTSSIKTCNFHTLSPLLVQEQKSRSTESEDNLCDITPEFSSKCDTAHDPEPVTW